METDTVKNTNIELVNADFWKNEMGSNPEKSHQLKPFSQCEWNRPVFLKIDMEIESGSSWGTALVIIKKYLLLDWLYP